MLFWQQHQNTILFTGAKPKAIDVNEGLRTGVFTTEPPSLLTMVCWNVQGLEDNNLQKRTKAVCK